MLTQLDPTELGTWSDPAKAAERIMARALSACVEEMQTGTLDALFELLRHGDSATWSHCQYALAQCVGEYLDTCDDDVKSVYIYDNDWTPDDLRREEAGFAPIIHLIVWAQPKTAALRALIDVLNRALSFRLERLFGTPSATPLLDVQVIDDQDVSRRAGYGALLTSSRFRPAQVWKRQKASV